MDLTLSPAEEEFRDTLRAWIEEPHPGKEPEGDEASFAFRREWQRALNERGWATPARRCSFEAEGARNVVYWAAWALDHDPEAAAVAAHPAKAYASDAAVNICRSAMQVHGGIGFTWEHDLHLFLKRAESNARAFGDATWHREQVAAAYL